MRGERGERRSWRIPSIHIGNWRNGRRMRMRGEQGKRSRTHGIAGT
jgi:hypothetical protein